MKSLIRNAGVCWLILFSMVGKVKAEETLPVRPMDSVDLSRYVGRWYEIAKIPNWFQKKCARSAAAEYTLRPDGRIDVVNSCTQTDGSRKQAQGIAKVVDTKSNAQLKVSFVKLLGMQLFWGDYWILGLGENYEYVVVGGPDRKYGWILARTPTMSPEKLDQAKEVLRKQGYLPERFVLSLP